MAKVANMMPLHSLVHDVDEYRSFNAKSQTSLAECCKYFLGKRLNKAQQLSDWLARPLSERQLRYAALDAYATVMILAAIVKRYLDSKTDPSLPPLTSNITSKISSYLDTIVDNPELIKGLLQTLEKYSNSCV